MAWGTALSARTPVVPSASRRSIGRDRRREGRSTPHTLRHLADAAAEIAGPAPQVTRVTRRGRDEERVARARARALGLLQRMPTPPVRVGIAQEQAEPEAQPRALGPIGVPGRRGAPAPPRSARSPSPRRRRAAPARPPRPATPRRGHRPLAGSGRRPRPDRVRRGGEQRLADAAVPGPPPGQRHALVQRLADQRVGEAHAPAVRRLHEQARRHRPLDVIRQQRPRCCRPPRATAAAAPPGR